MVRGESHTERQEGMEKEQVLRETELFVLDMDGTFYLGDKLLEGALGFLEQVKRLGKRFVFFTNNSSRSPKDYIEKLGKMGCEITRQQIMTSGDVMIRYLGNIYIFIQTLFWLQNTEPILAEQRATGVYKL